MVLDHDLFFTEEEVTFQNVMPRAGDVNIEGGPDPNRNRNNRSRRLGRFPL